MKRVERFLISVGKPESKGDIYIDIADAQNPQIKLDVNGQDVNVGVTKKQLDDATSVPTTVNIYEDEDPESGIEGQLVAVIENGVFSLYVSHEGEWKKITGNSGDQDGEDGEDDEPTDDEPTDDEDPVEPGYEPGDDDDDSYNPDDPGANPDEDDGPGDE